MKTNIGISEKEIKTIVPELEKFLASESVLNLKIRNYHWNVEGSQFGGLHSFFEWLYNSSSEHIDEIAERIRMLGEKSPATMKDFLEKSFISEETNLELNSSDMLSNLLSDTEKTIQEIRKSIEIISETNDFGTEDFLVASMQNYEKTAWMLRSMK